MDYSTSLRHICHVLNENAVEYMVIGDTAVAFYGYYRPSTDLAGKVIAKPDFDLWYNPTYENYYHLLDAIEQLGKDVSAHREEQQPDPRNAFFKLSFDAYTLDLLPRIKSPLPFWSSFKRRAFFESEGVHISFLSLEDLIRDKEIDPRPQDLDDSQQLKRR